MNAAPVLHSCIMAKKCHSALKHYAALKGLKVHFYNLYWGQEITFTLQDKPHFITQAVVAITSYLYPYITVILTDFIIVHLTY